MSALMKPATIAALILPCLAAGCILVSQQQATRAKTALVGKTRAEILGCAGVPNSTYGSDGAEYFAYAGGATVNNNQCVMTIAFTGGRVSSVSYRAVGGAITAPEEACGQMVRACL